jgi:hypothetical protein
LLLLGFANRSLIHIFALQNPQIVSIYPQSHCVGVNAFSSPYYYSVSLLREGCACDAACCMIRRYRHRWLLHSYGVSNGPTDSIRCLTHSSLCKRLRHLRADFDVSWLNSTRTLICGTRFPKKQKILAHPHHLGNTEQMIMFHHPNTTFPHSSTTM